jgi:glyoxylase-like metal-dependent hydrolase (beta-lactamase superfamily II)
MRRAAALAASCVLGLAAPAFSQSADVQDLGHGIYRAAGVMGGTAVRVPQSNTFMIVTRDGNVIVDTSIAAAAPAHKRALTAMNAGPIKAIVLTHAHGDHTGGVALWRQPGTEIIAQRAHEDFAFSCVRLSRSSAAQFGLEEGWAPRPRHRFRRLCCSRIDTRSNSAACASTCCTRRARPRIT